MLGWPLLVWLVWSQSGWWLLVWLGLSGYWCSRKPSLRIQALGIDNGQWWIQQNQRRLNVQWRSGWRRSDLLVLRYGRWPWQALVVRRQHLASAEAFRQLKAALYGLLPATADL